MKKNIIAVLCAFAILLTPCLSAAQKFPNKDTATDRQDETWGTGSGGDGAYFETGADGDNNWGTTPSEPREEPDYYENMIINVSPSVDWPTNSSTTVSTTTTGNATSGGINGTQTTTTTTTNN